MILNFNKIWGILNSKRKQSPGQFFYDFVLRKIPDNGVSLGQDHVQVFSSLVASRVFVVMSVINLYLRIKGYNGPVISS